MSNGTIEVERLSKRYGTTQALEDVTFQVKTGEILGLLGPNGAGKTTTMRILAGYLPATRGTARVAGFEVHENSLAVRQRIGYLPESPPLYPDLTVEEFLFFVARIKQVPAGDRNDRVTSAIRRCSLSAKRKVRIHKLSKGFRQRVGIAQAIVHDPPAIVLDEPTAGLDPRQIIEVRNLIRSLAGKHTIVLSTHILPEASSTCDRVAILHRGRAIATDTPERLQVQLAAGEGYEIEVAATAAPEDALAEAIAAIARLPGVRSVERGKATAQSDRQVLSVASEPDTEPGKDILPLLVARQIPVYEMRRTRASLEDVFLKLTTEEVAADVTPNPTSDPVSSDGETFPKGNREASQEGVPSQNTTTADPELTNSDSANSNPAAEAVETPVAAEDAREASNRSDSVEKT